MNVLNGLKKRVWLQAALALVAAIVGVALVFIKLAGSTAPIDSYDACVEAGNPILETNPPICRDGAHNFTGTPYPQASPAAPLTSVPFDILVDGDTHADTPAHSQQFISTQAHWERFWREVHTSLAATPPLIPVDFTTASVVAVSLGSRPTGGYGLKITNISTSSAGSVVSLTESTPIAACMVTQAATNRYLIVRTAKLAEPVSFRITTEDRRCP